MSKVCELMNKQFVMVTPSTSIVEVAKKLKRSEMDVVPVCEHGKLRGIITQESLISQIIVPRRNPKRECAASLMQNHLPLISPGTDAMEAAKIMAGKELTFLPVVDGGRLVGILTLENLIAESPALAFMVMAKHRASGPPDTNHRHHKRNSATAAKV